MSIGVRVSATFRTDRLHRDDRKNAVCTRSWSCRECCQQQDEIGFQIVSPAATQISTHQIPIHVARQGIMPEHVKVIPSTSTLSPKVAPSGHTKQGLSTLGEHNLGFKQIAHTHTQRSTDAIIVYLDRFSIWSASMRGTRSSLFSNVSTIGVCNLGGMNTSSRN